MTDSVNTEHFQALKQRPIGLIADGTCSHILRPRGSFGLTPSVIRRWR